MDLKILLHSIQNKNNIFFSLVKPGSQYCGWLRVQESQQQHSQNASLFKNAWGCLLFLMAPHASQTTAHLLAWEPQGNCMGQKMLFPKWRMNFFSAGNATMEAH